MGSLLVDFHWSDQPSGSHGRSTVAVRTGRGYIAVKLGDEGAPAELTIFFPSSVSAYSFAAAVMTGAEQLEKAEQATKPDPERPWVDVPLPLDNAQLPEDHMTSAPTLDEVASACLHGSADECAKVGCADEMCARF